MSPLPPPHKIIDFASFDEKILAKSMILLYPGCFTVMLCGVAHYIYLRYRQLKIKISKTQLKLLIFVFKILAQTSRKSYLG
jgi:hypothetical protein